MIDVFSNAIMCKYNILLLAELSCLCCSAWSGRLAPQVLGLVKLDAYCSTGVHEN